MRAQLLNNVVPLWRMTPPEMFINWFNYTNVIQ